MNIPHSLKANAIRLKGELMFLVLSFSILFNEVIKERNNLRRTRGDNASGTGTGHLHSNFGIAGQCVARKRAMWKLDVVIDRMWHTVSWPSSKTCQAEHF